MKRQNVCRKEDEIERKERSVTEGSEWRDGQRRFPLTTAEVFSCWVSLDGKIDGWSWHNNSDKAKGLIHNTGYCPRQRWSKREPLTADSHVSRTLSRFTGAVLSNSLQLFSSRILLGPEKGVLLIPDPSFWAFAQSICDFVSFSLL